LLVALSESFSGTGCWPLTTQWCAKVAWISRIDSRMDFAKTNQNSVLLLVAVVRAVRDADIRPH
jgi:hypothetical protein